MKQTIIILLLLLPAMCKAGFPMEYLEQFRKIFSDNRMRYEMTCVYPDSTSLTVRGITAVHGNNYYDSSNVRYVLYNDDWYIAADHLHQLVSVTYLANLKKEVNGLGTLAISSYLFGSDFFREHVTFKKLKEKDDTLWVDVRLAQDTLIQSMVVKLMKGSLVPLGYDLNVRCPVNRYGYAYADEDPEAVISIRMHCYDITYPAPVALFRSENIVDVAGKKATLKRYRNYQTHLGHY